MASSTVWRTACCIVCRMVVCVGLGGWVGLVFCLGCGGRVGLGGWVGLKKQMNEEVLSLQTELLGLKKERKELEQRFEEEKASLSESLARFSLRDSSRLWRTAPSTPATPMVPGRSSRSFSRCEIDLLPAYRDAAWQPNIVHQLMIGKGDIPVTLLHCDQSLQGVHTLVCNRHIWRRSASARPNARNT